MLSPSSIAFLKRLLDAPAPSGFETVAARVWRTEAGTFADKVTTDVAGNSMAEVNPGGSPTIMLDGHIDEIGVIIQYIDEEGISTSPRSAAGTRRSSSGSGCVSSAPRATCWAWWARSRST